MRALSLPQLLLVLLLQFGALAFAFSKAHAATNYLTLSEVYFLSSKLKKRALVCHLPEGKPLLRMYERTEGNEVYTRRIPTRIAYPSALRKARRECGAKSKAPACSNGRDEDADGTRDFPADSDCESLTDESEQADASQPEGPQQVMGKPFLGDPFISNHFDHNYPFQYQDDNGFQLTCDNERSAVGIDGHQGIDFRLAEGSEIVAAADGMVTQAGYQTPFYCPLLEQTVSGLRIELMHSINGETFYTSYSHLSQVLVEVGATISKGSLLGLSGNTGCSTGPHLHFEVKRQSSDRLVSVDPFGWNSSESDPWALHSQGAESLLLWKNSEAPTLFRASLLAPNPNPGNNASVALVTLRWMGRLDAITLNNEYLELQLDTRYSSGSTFDLSGYRIKNNAGQTYTFPSGSSITSASTIKVWTGSGTNDASNYYMQSATPFWDNNGDCAHLFRPGTGSRMYALRFGDVSCSASAALLATQEPGGSGSAQDTAIVDWG